MKPEQSRSLRPGRGRGGVAVLTWIVVALAGACSGAAEPVEPAAPVAPAPPGAVPPPSSSATGDATGDATGPASPPPVRPAVVDDSPCSAEECSRAPMYPTEQCADGSHIGGRGPCVRFEDGHCGWVRLTCPERAAPDGALQQCRAGGCGSAPVAREWSCGDGRRGAFEACVRRPGGCGWLYRRCLPAAPPAPPVEAAKPPPVDTDQPPRRARCGKLPSDAELKRWPVQSICQPGGGPAPPRLERKRNLGDGTYIFEGLGRCFRARYRTCHTKCLPPDTLIDTPSGPIAIRELELGAEVWTRDRTGIRVAAPVIATASPRVEGRHQLVKIVLADGRTVTASPGHPMVGGRLAGQFEVGQPYDGSEIREVEVEPFTGSHTYDLLPSGATGIYWADGVPMESTLRPRE